MTVPNSTDCKPQALSQHSLAPQKPRVPLLNQEIRRMLAMPLILSTLPASIHLRRNRARRRLHHRCPLILYLSM